MLSKTNTMAEIFPLFELLNFKLLAETFPLFELTNNWNSNHWKFAISTKSKYDYMNKFFLYPPPPAYAYGWGWRMSAFSDIPGGRECGVCGRGSPTSGKVAFFAEPSPTVYLCLSHWGIVIISREGEGLPQEDPLHVEPTDQPNVNHLRASIYFVFYYKLVTPETSPICLVREQRVGEYAGTVQSPYELGWFHQQPQCRTYDPSPTGEWFVPF